MPVKAKAPVISETYLEVDGIQYNISDLEDKVKADYKASGHRIGCIKSLRTYINTNERKAYYIINEKEKGEIML